MTAKTITEINVLGTDSLTWCDCDSVIRVCSNGTGVYHDKPDGCLTWVAVTHPPTVKLWGLHDSKRPRDRVVPLNYTVAGWVPPKPLSMAELFNKYEKAIQAELGADPFCTPCGGFRTHKLGCPTRRKT